MMLIILSYIAICIAVCFFKRIMPILLGVGFVAGWYMICYGGMVIPGAIVFAAMCIVTAIYRIANGETFEEKSKGERTKKNQNRVEKTRRSDTNSGIKWIFYLIPIFWPFLIAKIVLSDKPRPTDMTPYDYEQHLKCNR